MLRGELTLGQAAEMALKNQRVAVPPKPRVEAFKFGQDLQLQPLPRYIGPTAGARRAGLGWARGVASPLLGGLARACSSAAACCATLACIEIALHPPPALLTHPADGPLSGSLFLTLHGGHELAQTLAALGARVRLGAPEPGERLEQPLAAVVVRGGLEDEVTLACAASLEVPAVDVAWVVEQARFGAQVGLRWAGMGSAGMPAGAWAACRQWQCEGRLLLLSTFCPPPPAPKGPPWCPPASPPRSQRRASRYPAWWPCRLPCSAPLPGHVCTCTQACHGSARAASR